MKTRLADYLSSDESPLDDSATIQARVAPLRSAGQVVRDDLRGVLSVSRPRG